MGKIKGKKGVSQIIAFVLLMSFAVGLGTVVILWYSQSTEKQAEALITPAEGKMECENALVNVQFPDANTLKIYNAGTITFESVKVICTSGGERVNIGSEIGKVYPKSLSEGINLLLQDCDEAQGFEVIPIIEVGGSPFSCPQDRMFEFQS